MSERNFRIGLTAILLPVLATAATPASAQAGDATKGKAVFARCAICHSVEPGVKKMGPTLSGVFGRKAGTTDFAYSPAMKAAKLTWNAKTLDSYVTKPAALVPQTKMMFPGIANPVDRSNLIAYLEQATKAK